MAWRACVPVLAALLLAGCGGGGGGTPGGGSSSGDNVAPVLSAPAIDQTTFGSTGGQATIRVTVQDTTGVHWVRAVISPSNGAAEIRDLTLQPGGFYQVVYSVPANLAANDVTYGVTLSAADTVGNVSSPLSAGTIRVLGDVSPPPPPDL